MMMHVKSMSRSEFNAFIATCILAVKRKKAEDLQQVVVWLEARLKQYMEAQWCAQSAVHYVQNSDDILSHKRLPQWFWDLECVIWNPHTRASDKSIVHQIIFTKKGLDFSLLLAGPPAVNKTLLLLILAKLKTIMRKREQWLHATNMDDYGPLTLKGLVADAGCVTWDNVDLADFGQTSKLVFSGLAPNHENFFC